MLNEDGLKPGQEVDFLTIVKIEKARKNAVTLSEPEQPGTEPGTEPGTDQPGSESGTADSEPGQLNNESAPKPVAKKETQKKG